MTDETDKIYARVAAQEMEITNLWCRSRFVLGFDPKEPALPELPFADLMNLRNSRLARTRKREFLKFMSP